MAENFIESEIANDRGVDSLKLRVDIAKLEAFQNTLKGTESRGMNAFIEKLNTLEALNMKADEIRQKQGSLGGNEAPVVAGITVPIINTDQEVVGHNDKVRTIHQSIQEFNANRNQFLSTFISRYITPRPVRDEPRVGQRVPPRTGPDYFTYMRERAQDPLTPEQLAEAKYTAFLESPDAKKFDAMSDDEVKQILAGFRTQGLGKLVAKYEGMPDRDMVKRMMFDMKSGSVTGQIEAGLRMIAQYLTKK